MSGYNTDMADRRLALGLDFGTESVRALLVDVASGDTAGQGVAAYVHGVIDRELPGGGGRLPADYALQHPQDWLESAGEACRAALNDASARGAGVVDAVARAVVGIGVDFTSCTMLPCRAEGTPLCLAERWSGVPLAWPKLWKHHGAKRATDRINVVARDRREPWLARYGGVVGLEWFFPKILETLTDAPDVYAAAEVWLEAGDWFVWQLVDGPFPGCDPRRLVRSTCQAGYKALWNRQAGYPSVAFLSAVHPRLGDVVARAMPGTLRAPGQKAGVLNAASAERLGLPAGVAVSVATIDAHAGVPGAGVASPDTMVLVMGTSSCHMLNSRVERLAPGIAGVVEDGILPGFFGYETGQASVGDAFAWFVDTFGLSHQTLTRAAEQLPPGAGGVMAIDWLNGCRTPLMDGRLSGALLGLTLSTRPEQLYRALLEATAFGVRWIVDTLVEAGVPVERFVASGGLPLKSPLLMQIYADVLNRPIALAESDQPVALGAAIMGRLAAGATGETHPPTGGSPADVSSVVGAMARQRADIAYRPSSTKAVETYDALYRTYRRLTAGDGAVAGAMRVLRQHAGTA